MATKVGYVRRDPTEQINWAEVGSNFSGILKEEARVREEKKAEIDRSTREMQKVLQESPMGDSDNMNTWALSYAAEAQSQLLMTNALLKNGQLKPQDYTVIRQNLADGTDQAFTLVQEYQNEYADKMARMKAEFGGIGPDGNPITPSQELEQFLMGTAEGFGNFSKSKLVINPTTGNVMVGFINDKGEIESDPNKLVGINNLRNRIKGKFDKYDMQANITKAKAETFGKYSFVKAQLGTLHQKGLLETYKGAALRGKNAVDALISKGIITKEEAELMGSFEKTQDAWAESQLSNDYNTTSLLTNNLGGFAPNGKQYNFTFNPAEENENTILLKQVDGNVVPNFDSKVGKAHREAAKEGLLTNLRGALDLEVDAQAISGTQYQQPTPQRFDEAAYEAKKEREAKAGRSIIWNKIATATTQVEKQRWANALLGDDQVKQSGLDKLEIVREGNIWKLSFGYSAKTEKNRTIKFDAGNTLEQWAAYGSEVHGISNPNEAISLGGGGDPNALVNFSSVTKNGVRSKRSGLGNANNSKPNTPPVNGTPKKGTTFRGKTRGSRGVDENGL